MLPRKENFDHQRHGILSHVSSRLSDNSDFFVVSRELVSEHMLNLWSYNIKVVLCVLRAHGEPASNIKDIHFLHAFFFGHFKNFLSVQNGLFVRLESATSRANVEGDPSHSEIEVFASV